MFNLTLQNSKFEILQINRYKNLPTVWIGSKEKKVLVPFELCSLVPGQPIVRKYTEMQTRNMIREAATSTDVREKKIMNNFEMTNMNNQKCIREFGIHVGDKFTEVEARILEPPTVLYKQNSATPKRGAWNISEFLKACTINTWTILSLCFIKDHDIINLERMVSFLILSLKSLLLTEIILFCAVCFLFFFSY